MSSINDKEELIYNNKILDLDLSVINDIVNQTWRKYLNIYRREEKWEIDLSTIYCLSYIQQDISIDIHNLEYIKDILLKYINYLNKNSNNTEKIPNLTKDIVPEYEKWKSVLLDITSENWEKYKAWSLFVKNYIKRDIKNWNTFFLDEKELEKILSWNDYIFYIFYIDKINQTFSFEWLKNILIWLNSNQKIIDFFINFELSDINNILENKFKIWKIDLIESDNFYKFKDELLKLENIDEYSVEDFALFISRKILSLHFSPYPLLNNDEWIKWNRKEILKASKTEDKLNNTFTNEIFNLALY